MANEVEIKFGSLQFDNTIAIESVEISESKSVNLKKIPKTHGSIAEEAKRESIRITTEGSVVGNDYDQLRSNIDALKAILQNGFQKFTIDDDRYVMAQLKDFETTFPALRTIARFKATFIAHFPFWLKESLSEDTRVPTSGVGYVINNAGNASARVKVEITAPAGGINNDIAVANETNGEGLRYTGVLAAGQGLVINNRVDQDDFEGLNNSIDDHKKFEGDFLTLEPGDNTITFTGTAGTQVKLIWRATYY